MTKKLRYAFITMGLSGLVAQIILLRELLVAFHGNELSIGIILANWMLLEAAGANILGRFITRFKNIRRSFILTTVLFIFHTSLSGYHSNL